MFLILNVIVGKKCLLLKEVLKRYLYNKEEANEGPWRSKRLAFSLQSNLRYEYETHMFSSLPIHRISLNYDLDL